MPVRPLDLQVNINSVLKVSSHEGSRISRIEAEHRAMDQKLVEQHIKSGRQVNQLEDANSSHIVDDKKRREEGTMNSKDNKKNQQKKLLDEDKKDIKEEKDQNGILHEGHHKLDTFA